MALFAPTAMLTVAAREAPTRAKPATMYEKTIVYGGRVAEGDQVVSVFIQLTQH